MRGGGSTAACPCRYVAESDKANILTDLPSLCSLHPLPRGLAGACASNVPDNGTAYLVWRLTQFAASECTSASQDLYGPCGDASATVVMAPACMMVHDNNTVLQPFVAVSDIDDLLDRHPTVLQDECTLEKAINLSHPTQCAERACASTQVMPSDHSPCHILKPPTNPIGRRGGSEVAPNMMQTGLKSQAFACVYTGAQRTLGLPQSAMAQLQASVPAPACHPQTVVAACSLEAQEASLFPTPAPVVYEQSQETLQTWKETVSACNATGCGTSGWQDVVYTSCGAHTLDAIPAGCVAYRAPENHTEPCRAEDCGSAVADVSLSPGEVVNRIDVNGKPCDSNVLDIHGVCCPGSAPLDPCGLCEGLLYATLPAGPRAGYDIRGDCCVGALTPELSCCHPWDHIDECGKCKGRGTGCALHLSPQGMSPSNTQLHDIAAGMSRQPGISARAHMGQILVAHNPLARAEVTAAAYMQSAASIGIEVRVVLATAQVDSGARDEVQEDPKATYACPAHAPDPQTGMFLGEPASECGGLGVCDRALLQCRCSYGYMGDGCSSCSPGFTSYPSGSGKRRCVPSSASSVIDATLTAVTGGASDPTGTIVLAAVVAVVVAVTIITVAFKWRQMIKAARKCLRGDESEES